MLSIKNLKQLYFKESFDLKETPHSLEEQQQFKAEMKQKKAKTNGSINSQRQGTQNAIDSPKATPDTSVPSKGKKRNKKHKIFTKVAPSSIEAVVNNQMTCSQGKATFETTPSSN